MYQMVWCDGDAKYFYIHSSGFSHNIVYPATGLLVAINWVAVSHNHHVFVSIERRGPVRRHQKGNLI